MLFFTKVCTSLYCVLTKYIWFHYQYYRLVWATLKSIASSAILDLWKFLGLSVPIHLLLAVQYLPYQHLLLWPVLIYPHPDTTFVFFGYLFVYLNLVSVHFTHCKITFCLPPSVIFHFYFTCLYQNVFCFTSLALRSIFVYLAFF